MHRLNNRLDSEERIIEISDYWTGGYIVEITEFSKEKSKSKKERYADTHCTCSENTSSSILVIIFRSCISNNIFNNVYDFLKHIYYAEVSNLSKVVTFLHFLLWLIHFYMYVFFLHGSCMFLYVCFFPET